MILFNLKNQKGFTLTETMLAVAIFSSVVVAIGAFQRDIFFFNDVLQTGLSNVTEARKVLRPFVGEVRRAETSNLGASSIEKAEAKTFIFYTDVDGDDLKERVRYFVDGSTFKKGVIKPTGTPYAYNVANEKIISVVNYVIEDQTQFSYFDSSYNGTASSSPLTYPISPSSVRLVKVDLTIDTNPDRAPGLLTVTTQATVRNLKDNYEN
jgi:prepilin-type N-terminal cleavage/methylation domain-containing protein